MKAFSFVAAMALAIGSLGTTACSAEPSSADQISSIVKVGEVYQLETITPLIDGPDRVTIREYGPKSWVLVDYEASVLAPGELQPKARKGQMWVNFDQVVAARRIVPESTTPAPIAEKQQ